MTLEANIEDHSTRDHSPTLTELDAVRPWSSRTTLVLIACLAGCGPSVVSGSSSPAASQGSSSAPSQAAVSASPRPTAGEAGAILDAAEGFAAAAGYKLTGAAPTLDRGSAAWEPEEMWLVSIPISSSSALTTLRVYLEDSREVRVAEADLSFAKVPSGSAISRDDALSAAAHALELAGIEATTGQLDVWSSIAGQQWTVMLNRTIDGYPVANHWAATGLGGDRVWAELTGDGGLAELYAVRPNAKHGSELMPSAQLADALSTVSGLSRANLAALAPGLIWIRALDADGIEAADLSLNYCATRTSSSGWESWCVDAGSGQPSAHSLAAD